MLRFVPTRRALIAGAAIVLVTLAALWATWRNHQQHRLTDLQGIADAGAHSLDDWVAQQVTDARAYRASRNWSDLVARWQADRADPSAPLQLTELKDIKLWQDVSVYDEHGALQWSSAPNAVPPRLDAGVPARIERSDVVFESPESDDRGLTLAMTTPLGRESGGPRWVLRVRWDGDRTIGRVVSRLKAAHVEGDFVLLMPRVGGGWDAFGPAPEATGAKPAEADVVLVSRPALTRLLPAGVDRQALVAGHDEWGVAYTAALHDVPTAGWRVMILSDDSAYLRSELAGAVWIGLSGLLAIVATAVALRLRGRDEALARALLSQRHHEDQKRTLGLLHTVMDSSSVVMVAQDLEGNCLLCSDEAARLAGLREPPQPGTALAELLPREMLLRPGGTAEPLAAGSDERWPTRVGPRIYWVARGALRDDQGETYGTYVIARDVTSMRESAAAQQRSEEQLALALHGAGLGMWDWHVPSGRVEVNERWVEMLGYRMADVEPQFDTMRSLVHPDDLPPLDEALASHMQGQRKDYRAEVRLRHRDGH